MSARTPTESLWHAGHMVRSPRPTPRVRASAAEAWRRWRTRRTLAELDDRMLHDIGASRAEAQAESAKPFWRA